MRHVLSVLCMTVLLAAASARGWAQMPDARPAPAPPDSGYGYVRPFFLPPAYNSDINAWKLAGVGTAAVSSLGATWIYLENTWWDEGGTSFHFDGGGDMKYALNLDKAAHFYGGLIAADIFYGALRWSGMSDRAAAWTGAGLGSFVQVAIELKDGFAPRWGFSPWDVGTGIAGSFLFVGKQYLPVLDAIDIKLSYYKRSNRYFELKTHGATWNDDYVNQTYWASVKVNRLLPASVEPWWPDWLAVAVGVGVDDKIVGFDIDKPDRTGGSHEIILALDVDLTEVLPSDSPVWEAIKYYLNYIKFPAPAVRITPGAVWYGLYF